MQLFLLFVAFAALAAGQNADVGVAISARDQMTIGDRAPYQYQVNIANAGPNDGFAVVMRDPVPLLFTIRAVTAQYSNGTITCDPIASFVNNTVLCRVPQLRAGDVARVLINVTQDDAGLAPQNVSNTAFVSAATNDPDPSNNQNTKVTRLVQSADVAVNIQGAATAVAGQADPICFTVTTTNQGLSNANTLTTRFKVFEGFLFSSVNQTLGPAGTCAFEPQVSEVVCTYPGGLVANGVARTRVCVIVPATLTILENDGGDVVTWASASSITFDPNLLNNNDTTTTVLSVRADVSVTKGSLVKLIAGQQDVLVYTLVVENTGPSTARGVVLTDQLPFPFTTIGRVLSECNITPQEKKREFLSSAADMSRVALREGAPCRQNTTCTVIANNFLRCSIPELNTPERVVVVVESSIAPGALPANGVFPWIVNNTAFVTSATSDPNRDRNQDSALTEICLESDVEVLKSGFAGSIISGDPTTYFYTVTTTNLGISKAYGVVLTDNVPQPMLVTGDAVVIEGTGSCTRAGNNIRCDWGDMEVGERIVIRIPFVVPANAATVGNIVNTAVATVQLNDTNLVNNVANWTNLVLQAPDVSVLKTGPSNLTVGSSNVEFYTILVQNAGPSDAENGRLTDNVPSAFVVQGPVTTTQGSCVNTGNNVSCDLGRLPVGAFVTIIVPFTIAPETTQVDVSNTAFVFTTSPDRDPSNNNSTQETVLIRSADLETFKNGPTRLCAGGPEDVFNVLVRNLGPTDAVAVVITDPLPIEMAFGVGAITIVGNQTAASCAYEGRVLRCQLGNMAVGSSVTVSYFARVLANQPAVDAGVINTATATSLTPDPNTNNNADDHLTIICAEADLAIVKVAPPQATAGSGQVLSYVLNIRNNGLADSVNVVVSDAIPAAFTALEPISVQDGAGSCTLTGVAGAQTVVCNFARLLTNEVRTISIPFQVGASVAANTYQNCATIASLNTTDPISDNNQSCDNTIVLVNSDLQVAKTGEAVVCAGEAGGLFTVTIVNNGPSVATVVQLRDQLNTIFTPGSSAGIIVTPASAGSCVFEGQLLRCNNLGSLAVGASIVVRYPFSVGANVPAQTNVANTAIVSSLSSDGVTTNNESTHLTDICANADIRVQKTGSATATAGVGVYQYTIAVSNAGPAFARGVSMSDDVPAAFTVQGVPTATGGGVCVIATGTTNSVRCNWSEDFAVNRVETVVIQFTVAATVASGPYQNCASAVSTVNDPNNDNTDCFITQVDVSADLGIVKNGPNVICAGSPEQRFTLSVTNFGPAIARAAVVNDTLNAVFTPGSSAAITVSRGSCSYSGQVLSCSLGDLAVGESVQISYPIRVLANVARQAQVPNTAFVSATTGDGNTMNDQSTHFTDICNEADLAVTKTGSVTAIAGSGVEYSYQITVQNNGPATADGAFITDNIPAAFTPGAIETIDVSGGGVCTYVAQNSLQCVWASFPVSANYTVTIPFTVAAGVTAGSRTNCVNVLPATGGPIDPITSNNQACTMTMVNLQANLNIAKSGPSDVCAGDGITYFYTVTVNNAGPSDAQAVQVIDNVPSQLTVLTAPAIQILNVDGTVASGASCTFAAPILTCSLGALSGSGTDQRRIIFPFTVDSGVQAQIVTNVATVSSPTAEVPGGGFPNTASFSTAICAQADLAIIKTGPVSVIAGSNDVQQFTLAVQNNGLADAYNVTVADANIPTAFFDVIGATSQAGVTCTVVTSISATSVSCFYPVMVVGQTDTIVITFRVPSGAVPGPRENCATINSAVTADVIQSNNRDCAIVNIIAQADIVTQKTGPAVVTAGLNSPIHSYTVTVSNQGGSDALSVSLNDPMPAGFVATAVRLNAGDTGSCSIVNNVVICNLGTKAPGASSVITVDFTVAADVSVGPRTNTACATTITPETTTANNCDDHITQVVCDAVLTINKTDNVDQVVAGAVDTLVYTIEISNAGPSTSRSTVVTDTFPPQFNLVLEPTTSQGSCSVTGTGFVCQISDLNPGASAIITVGYTVPANAIPGIVRNEACVSNACGAQTSICAVDDNTVIRQIDLFVVKDDCVDTVLAGESAPTTFTITTINRGPSDAPDFVLTDAWPIVYQMGEITTSPAGATCDVTATSFACRWAVLPAGVTATVTVEYTVAATTAAQFATNCAFATTSGAVVSTGDDRDCDTNRIISQADLEITKTIDNNDCVVAGSPDVRQYTVTVTNKGPSTAFDVVVFDQFPVDLMAVGPALCSIENGSNYTCQLGTLALGEQVQLVWRFTVGASRLPGLVENFASVTSSTMDPELCNNNATVCSIICAQSDLSVTKDDGVRVVTAGDLVTYYYQIVGTNAGPSDARDVTFVDVWPTEFARGSVNAIGADVVITSDGFVVTLPYLAAGDSYAFNVSYTVPACELACTACNFVTIASPYEDPDETNNQAKDCNELRTEANLEVCKDDGVTTVTAGDGITYEYTIQVANNGPSCAQKVKLVDHFPKAVFQIPGSIVTTQGTCINVNGSDVSCNLQTLQPGQVVQVLIKYTVPANADTCSVTNIVTVSSLTFDPELCNNDAKDVNALVERAEVSLIKTDGLTTIASTDTSAKTYTIVVGNSGPSTARDVVVTDVWPAGFVQFLESLHVSSGHCVGTGTDFTCSVGDVAVGETVTITVSYSLMQPPMCGAVTNKVNAFSPTDEICREAQDLTIVDCASPTDQCVNCAIAAVETPGGGCNDYYTTTCLGNAACESCYNSIKANPRAPVSACFSDPIACGITSCIYNAGGPCAGPVGQGGGPCRSPDQVDVTCPALPTIAPSTSEPSSMTTMPASGTPGIFLRGPINACPSSEFELVARFIPNREAEDVRIVLDQLTSGGRGTAEPTVTGVPAGSWTCVFANQAWDCSFGSLSASTQIEMRLPITAGDALGSVTYTATFSASNIPPSNRDLDSTIVNVIACDSMDMRFTDIAASPLITPASRRAVISSESVVRTSLAKSKSEFQPRKRLGKVLSPKVMHVEATMRGDKTVQITVRNPLRRLVTLEELSVQLVKKNGKVVHANVVTDDKTVITSTTCRQTQGRELRMGWSSVCDVTFANLADVSSIKVAARGIAQLSTGYHPVMGSRAVSVSDKQ